jgi:hypothetical protein
MTPGGIFCLEGQWDRDLADRSSVEPTLDLLNRLGLARFIHKDVATREELEYFLDRWLLKKYADYRVGFFAMHGEPTRLLLTDRLAIGLDALASHLNGRCVGKRLYFASCSVMRTSDAALQSFLSVSGAALVCGYTREVDWIESAAFETIVLDALANGSKINAAEQRMSKSQWSPLASYLGFRIVYSNGRVWMPGRTARIPTQVAASTP